MYQDKKNPDEIEINLGGMIHALWHRAPIIILVTILCGIAAFMAAKLTFTPMYSSTTSMYVLVKNDANTSQSGSVNLTTSDLQVGQLLTKDYEVLIKSRNVAEQVIETLKLENWTPEMVQRRISVNVPTNTRVIEITTVSSDPEMAVKLADTTREVASKSIMSMMDVENIQTVDTANKPIYPYNNTNRKKGLIGAIGGFVLACAVVLFIFLTNDSIKTSEDIEKYLHISTLATIPLAEGGKRNSRKQRRNEIRKAEKAHKTHVKQLKASKKGN